MKIILFSCVTLPVKTWAFMMKRIKYLMIGCLMFSSIGLHADERLRILGFELGKPIDLPACEKQYESYPKYVNVTCVQSPQGLKGYDEKIRRISLAIEESPSWLKFNRLFAYEREGILVGISFITTGFDTQALLINMLTNKLGKETYFQEHVLRNKFGTKFILFRASWGNGDVVADYIPAFNEFDSKLNDLDSAEVIYETRLGREYRESIKRKINPTKIRSL